MFLWVGIVLIVFGINGSEVVDYNLITPKNPFCKFYLENGFFGVINGCLLFNAIQKFGQILE